MIRLLRSLLLGSLATLLIPLARANAEQIDEQLQRAVLDYAIQTGGDISAIKTNTENILLKLSSLNVSPCELSSELQGKRPVTVTDMRYILNDLLEEKLRSIKLSQELIADRLKAHDGLSRTQVAAIERLAIRVSSNSMSLTELRESILPRIFEATEAKLSQVDAIDVKIDLLELEIRRLDSVCDKVAILWQEREQRIALKPEYPQDQRTHDPQPSHTATNSWQSVNGTRWEPQAYASRTELCANPTPGPQNISFDTNVLTNIGWVRYRYFGDIWVDCSGRIVMVLRN